MQMVALVACRSLDYSGLKNYGRANLKIVLRVPDKHISSFFLSLFKGLPHTYENKPSEQHSCSILGLHVFLAPSRLFVSSIVQNVV